MTSNQARTDTLTRALRAAIDRDGEVLQGLLTADVRAWSPALSTGSRDELLEELDRRDETFGDFALDVTPLDVGGDHACIEWTVEMTHTGAITLADDRTIEATGIRVIIHGVTVAEFLGEAICSLRQYWDEMEVLEQLGALTRHEQVGS